MNEKDVLKQSVKVFIGGLIIFSIVGFVLKQISFPLGFILGYAVSVLSFYIKNGSGDSICCNDVYS